MIYHYLKKKLNTYYRQVKDCQMQWKNKQTNKVCVHACTIIKIWNVFETEENIIVFLKDELLVRKSTGHKINCTFESKNT